MSRRNVCAPWMWAYLGRRTLPGQPKNHADNKHRRDSTTLVFAARMAHTKSAFAPLRARTRTRTAAILSTAPCEQSTPGVSRFLFVFCHNSGAKWTHDMTRLVIGLETENVIIREGHALLSCIYLKYVIIYFNKCLCVFLQLYSVPLPVILSVCGSVVQIVVQL